MSQSWMVTVEGQAYGPYPLEQMTAFIAEGRIVAQSLIGPPGQAPYPAGNDPAFMEIFNPPKPRAAAVAERLAPAERAPMQKFGRNAEEGDGQPCHFVILADIKSRSINGFEEAVFNLGQAYPLLPMAWLLTSTFPLNAVRNALVQTLGTLDVLFVVDTTHDKAAWYNFGPEADARIRRIWNKLAARERKSG